MKKLIALLSINSMLLWTALSVIACSINFKLNPTTIKTPNWVNNMVKILEKEPKKINIGYDHFFLINKVEDKNDLFQQKDWINLNKNQNLYLYLPEANNIDEAAHQIKIDDSAKTWTVGIETPITWKKINNTTYTNNNFITQDSTVAGIALMDNSKFKQIESSAKFNNLAKDEKEKFKKWGSLDTNAKNKNWWNSNGWEKLLSDEKNLTSNDHKKVSQLDLYKKWTSPESILGMNVPLSLIDKGTFKLQATTFKHIFLFSTTPQQAWINNNGNKDILNTPHWGFTMNIVDVNQNNKVLFKTPQLFNPKNAYKEEKINNYLKERNYYSFNSQEDSNFKDYYIN